ncbi:hypothetical protein JHK87_055347 [Glycine soja]|nr:hypothetical protein JHK87_055347 [Glycine soja]
MISSPMGNCCRSPAIVARKDVKSSFPNAFIAKQKAPITFAVDVSKENIEDRYLVDRELGHDEFSLTYLCIDRDMCELFTYLFL